MNEPHLVPKHIRPIFDLIGKIWLIRTELEILLLPPHEPSFSTEQLNELSSVIVKLKQIESELIDDMQQKMKS